MFSRRWPSATGESSTVDRRPNGGRASARAGLQPCLFCVEATSSGSEEPRRLKPALPTLSFLLFDLCDADHYVLPFEGLRSFRWVPFLLDDRCAPMLIGFVVSRITRRDRTDM